MFGGVLVGLAVEALPTNDEVVRPASPARDREVRPTCSPQHVRSAHKTHAARTVSPPNSAPRTATSHKRHPTTKVHGRNHSKNAVYVHSPGILIVFSLPCLGSPLDDESRLLFCFVALSPNRALLLGSVVPEECCCRPYRRRKLETRKSPWVQRVLQCIRSSFVVFAKPPSKPTESYAATSVRNTAKGLRFWYGTIIVPAVEV